MSLLLPQNPHASFQVRVASVTGCVVSFVICEDADQAFRFTRVCALRERKKKVLNMHLKLHLDLHLELNFKTTSISRFIFLI
jgi:hypothetical protein